MNSTTRARLHGSPFERIVAPYVLVVILLQHLRWIGSSLTGGSALYQKSNQSPIIYFHFTGEKCFGTGRTMEIGSCHFMPVIDVAPSVLPVGREQSKGSRNRRFRRSDLWQKGLVQ